MPWNDESPWESGTPPWEQPVDDSAWATSSVEAWRGDLHTSTWPDDPSDGESWMHPSDD